MAEIHIQVKWTPFAFHQLDEIFEYILFKEKSFDLAQKIVRRIFNRTDQLKEFPESGSHELLLKDKGQDSRYLLVANHKIIYEYHTATKIVIITDVFHTNQDPKNLSKIH